MVHKKQGCGLFISHIDCLETTLLNWKEKTICTLTMSKPIYVVSHVFSNFLQMIFFFFFFVAQKKLPESKRLCGTRGSPGGGRSQGEPWRWAEPDRTRATPPPPYWGSLPCSPPHLGNTTPAALPTWGTPHLGNTTPGERHTH